MSRRSTCLHLTQSSILSTLYSCKYTAAVIHLKALPKDAIRPAWWCINPYAMEQEMLMLAKHAKQKVSANQRAVADTLMRLAVHTLMRALTQREPKSFWAIMKRFSCRQTFLTASLFLLFWGKDKVLWNATSAGAIKVRWKNVAKHCWCHCISADLRVTQTHTHSHTQCGCAACFRVTPRLISREHVFIWQVSDVLPHWRFAKNLAHGVSEPASNTAPTFCFSFVFRLSVINGNLNKLRVDAFKCPF